MRLASLHVAAFGALTEFEVRDLADADVLVLLGPNESGKSTLHEFLCTALFGFRPANREQHPYAPWSGVNAEGHARFVLSDGRTAAVHRRLMSTPQGVLAIDGGDGEPLANRAVPWVGHVTRAMFDSLFALTADEAFELQQGAWSQVEDRLLGGASYSFLRSARDAAEDLQKQADGLWRNDRRGNPRAKVLQQLLKDLKDARKAALDRTDRVLALNRELDKLAEEIDEAVSERRKASTRLKWAADLLPVWRTLEQVASLRRRADDTLRGTSFPRDPGAQLQSRRESLTSLRADHDAKIAERRALRGRLEIPPAAKALTAAEPQITALVQQVRAHQGDLSRRDDYKSEAAAARDSLDRLAEQTLIRPIDGPVADALRRLPMAEVRGRIGEWEDGRRPIEQAEDRAGDREEEVSAAARRLAEAPGDEIAGPLRARLANLRALQALEAPAASGSTRPRRGWIAAAVIAAILVVVALVVGVAGVALHVSWAGIVAGVLLVAASGIFALFGRRPQSTTDRTRSRREAARLRRELGLAAEDDVEVCLARASQDLLLVQRRPELEQELAHAEDRAQRASKEVARLGAARGEIRETLGSLLASIPLATTHLEHPSSAQVADLGALRTALLRFDEASTRHEDADRAVQVRSASAAALLQGLDRDAPADAMDAITLLDRELIEARKVAQRAEEAGQALPAAEKQLKDLEASIDQTEQAVRELESALAALDPDSTDHDAGLALYEQALHRREQADILEQNLREEIPEWKDLAGEAASLRESGEELHLEIEEKETLEARVADRDQCIQDLRERQGKLAQERSDLQALPGADHVDGEIESVEEDLAGVKRQRDQRSLLRALIQRADRRYREQHQPPVLRAASAYVTTLTDGRYTSLATEDRSAGATLTVTTADDPFPRPVRHPLSRGTRQQLYLALRLALVDHIDSPDPLPLLLDEMFVNWDPTRTGAGLRILQDIARKRQVLLMTCQPRFAARVHEAVGARLIDLGASSA